MCAQAVGSLRNTKKIGHGLIDGYIIDVEAVLSAYPELSEAKWKVGGSALETQYGPPKYLAGAAAMAPATLSAILVGSPTVGSTIGVHLDGISAGGVVQRISIEADITTTLAQAVTDLIANFGIARAGSGTCTNGRIIVQELLTTLAQVGTGVTAKYAAASGSSPTITLTSAANNTGNDYSVTFYVKPKPPTLITLNASGDVVAPGVQKFCHIAEGGVTVGGTATENLIKSADSYVQLDSYTGDVASNITFGNLQDREVIGLQLASGITEVASANSYDIILPNILPTLRTFGLVFKVDSPDAPGNKDLIVIPRVKGLAFQRKFDKVHAPVEVTLTPQSVSGLTGGYFIQQYRPTLGN